MNDLTLLDYFALFYFLVVIFGYDRLTNFGALKNSNISAGVERQRAAWISTMLKRDNRIVDSQILISLSQGNAFFASTAMVITGALATALASANEIAGMLAEFPIPATSSHQLVSLKLTFMMIIFLGAFFKFAWAFRLTHYTSILIGAMPLETDADTNEARRHVEQTTKLSSLAGRQANNGLHTYYYGIAASGWLINGWVFLLATTLIILMLYRREFLSNSHNVLNPPEEQKTTQ